MALHSTIGHEGKCLNIYTGNDWQRHYEVGDLTKGNQDGGPLDDGFWVAYTNTTEDLEYEFTVLILDGRVSMVMRTDDYVREQREWREAMLAKYGPGVAA